METKILRNLGFQAPAPIRHLYDWPGRFKPFDAQREAAAFLSLNDRAFNLSELGTGKSLAALWAFDYLRSIGQLNRMLVIAPLSTLERTWADEVFNHFPHLTCVVLHGTRQRRKRLLTQEADVYVVNHDGAGILEEDLKARPDIDLVVVDEIAQAARNAGTDRWKAINKIVNRHTKPRACWGMTGTPTPNEPTDAWAQCRIIVPSSVPPYFNRFRNQVMVQQGQFKWSAKATATEVVHGVMQPSIRFTRDECLDLPPLMSETRSVGMTQDQTKAYKEMMTKLHVEAEEGKITAVNAAVKMGKLVQIACGVVYGNNGEEINIPATPRVSEVKSVIEQAEGKVIVFVPYVSAVEGLAKELAEWKGLNGKPQTGRPTGGAVEVIHGGVKKAERDRIFQAFQQATNPRVLVAQPAAMSHGLTLTKASTIVWYAPVTSNETFEQANGRINRPGQKMNNFIIMLEGTAIERRIYARLMGKQKMQGALLDEIKAHREAVIA